MKKRIIFLVAAGMMLFGIAGCSSANYEGANSQETQSMAPTENYEDFSLGEENGQDSFSAGSTELLDPALKIIRTSDIEMETEDIVNTLEAIKTQAAELGGYVENSFLDSFTDNWNRERKNASITIRVPGEHFEQAITLVATGNKIIAQYDNTENVTMRYIDYEGQLKVKRLEEERLLELIAQAQSIEAIITLESRLSEVRSDIEYFTGTLRAWDDLVKYATIHINLRETAVETVVSEYSIPQRVSNAFVKSVNEAGSFFTALLIFLIRHWVKIAILGIIFCFYLKDRIKRQNPIKKWVNRHKKDKIE